VIKDMLVDKERQVAGLSSRRHKKRSRYLRTARVNPKQVSAILSSTKNTTYVVPVAVQQGSTIVYTTDVAVLILTTWT